ncbi:MAG: hypothetical protein OEZ57_12795 [Nitrospirota bacterium]|nr:hypothetical protein [Nitrospirota bacterium]MDH5587822.1 hypothetical protein [Nitrospirota bacterium]MDH5775776.1 hypothetical protein [Nitrospirota bacterium]
MNKIPQIIIVLFLIMLTGCVLGRRTVDLPVQSFSDSKGTKGEVFIGDITDNRVFQNKPSDPSIPSIDGDVNSLTPQEKGMMIGRQRGGFGNAAGDVALPANDSVVARTRQLLEEGFKSRGYIITSDSTAPNSASATINKFWGWFTPGFWTITFEAHVNSTITLTKPDGPSTAIVQGYGRVQGQIASDANWQLAYQRAFQDFLSKLDSQLTTAGF